MSSPNPFSNNQNVNENSSILNNNATQNQSKPLIFNNNNQNNNPIANPLPMNVSVPANVVPKSQLPSR
jgi:hypothetical protein